MVLRTIVTFGETEGSGSLVFDSRSACWLPGHRACSGKGVRPPRQQYFYKPLYCTLRVRPWINRTGVLIRRGIDGTMHAQSEDRVRTQGGGRLQAVERGLRALISDFQPPELWENKLPVFKPSSVWHLVMVAGLTTATALMATARVPTTSRTDEWIASCPYNGKLCRNKREQTTETGDVMDEPKNALRERNQK